MCRCYCGTSTEELRAFSRAYNNALAIRVVSPFCFLEKGIIYICFIVLKRFFFKSKHEFFAQEYFNLQ